VVQGGRGLRLLAEAGEEVGIVTVLGAEDLHRHVALQLAVDRPKDGGHASLPEQLDEAIATAQDAADLRQTTLLTNPVAPSSLSPGPATSAASYRTASMDSALPTSALMTADDTWRVTAPGGAT
jgi:hypothetical protein